MLVVSLNGTYELVDGCPARREMVDGRAFWVRAFNHLLSAFPHRSMIF
jgi:hypothetical protein